MTAKKANPKGGRPKKEIKKEHAFTVRVTADRADEIKNKANKMNLTVSDYLEQSEKKNTFIEPDPNKIKILSELGKIGSNLNQIAKKVNQDEKFTEEEKKGLNQIYNRFKEIKELIQE
jgi:uncharacterized coiled-coil DUF342 family protein